MSRPLSKETLLKTGVCCGNGCKNCPYYPIHTKGSTEIFEIPDSVDCMPSCSLKTMAEGLCMCYLDFKQNNKKI